MSTPHFVSDNTACRDVIMSASQTFTVSTTPSAPPPSSSATSSFTQPTTSQQPMFSSHMSPIFTCQMATEQELHEKWHTFEALRLENA